MDINNLKDHYLNEFKLMTRSIMCDESHPNFIKFVTDRNQECFIYYYRHRSLHIRIPYAKSHNLDNDNNLLTYFTENLGLTIDEISFK